MERIKIAVLKEIRHSFFVHELVKRSYYAPVIHVLGAQLPPGNDHLDIGRSPSQAILKEDERE